MDHHGGIGVHRTHLKRLEFKKDVFDFFPIALGVLFQDELYVNGPRRHTKTHAPEIGRDRSYESLYKRQDKLVFCVDRRQGGGVQLGLVGTTLGLVEPLIMKTLVA